MDAFTRRLIAEALFYDEEYGALGSLGLVDEAAGRERYIASFMPEDGDFIIEKATAWDDTPPEDTPPEDDEDAVGYALATDSTEHARHDRPDAAADALLALAREHDLQPSLTLLFEDEAVY